VLYVDAKEYTVLLLYRYKYYYYKMCIARKFKQARVTDTGVARWET